MKMRRSHAPRLGCPAPRPAHRVPAMFEAQFQTFDDVDERAATAARVE